MAAKKELFTPMPRLIVDCAHHDCKTPAILKERAATGWADLCEFHWVQAHTVRAEKKCKELGLFTKQQKVDYCRQVLGGIVRRMVDREPGCDDEPERRYMPGVKAKEVAGA